MDHIIPLVCLDDAVRNIDVEMTNVRQTETIFNILMKAAMLHVSCLKGALFNLSKCNANVRLGHSTYYLLFVLVTIAFATAD